MVIENCIDRAKAACRTIVLPEGDDPRVQSAAARVAAEGIARILLTASGGPFRRHSLEDLSHVTPEQACSHPNWDMGRKISIDSATLMNKGLELIAAHHLFDVAPERIEVVIHPQSMTERGRPVCTSLKMRSPEI